MSAKRARLWLSSVMVATAYVALASGCGPSEAEIKAAADSLSPPKDSAAQAAAGDTAAARMAADSAARDSARAAATPTKPR
jgi:hypothetical protein